MSEVAKALEAESVADAPAAPPAPAQGAPAIAMISPPLRRAALGTRGRLLGAFALLAAAFAAAFGMQLVRLGRMQEGMDEIHDHQEEMHVALELEQTVRSVYTRQGRALAGEVDAVAVTSEEPAVAELVARLARSVDEPETTLFVARIDAATRALEERFRRDLAVVAAGGPLAQGAEQARFALVFEVEENVDRLFEFLRERSVAQSAAVETLRRESLALALAFAIALPLFAIGVGLYLAQVIARPLVVVGEAAARISRGDLRARILPRGPPEITALGVELNAMAASLEHHQERLVRSEKLAGLGRFAAGIAHEINNPLQVILGYLSLHRDRVPGELGVHLARVEREAERCKEIVEALLQLSRPAVSESPEPVDLGEVAQEVAAAIRVAMPAAAAVRVSGAAEALGCPARFRQVLFNLVKNAAEAAGPEGRVDVEVRCAGELARVVVTDSGPGIPAHLRARVFEPFFTTKASGTGLGLALARAIARAQGGDVELEDGAGGARFSLSAPRSGGEVST